MRIVMMGTGTFAEPTFERGDVHIEKTALRRIMREDGLNHLAGVGGGSGPVELGVLRVLQ